MQTTQTSLELGQAVWEAVLERGCGLDVHQKTVTACLLIGPLEEQPRESLRTFHTTTRGQVAYDSKALKLVEKTYKEQDNTGKQIVGASGTEYFNFKALTKGETKVTFTYRRPWEQPSAQDQTLAFTVNVK